METIGYIFAIGMGIMIGYFLHKIFRDKGKVE